MVKEILKIAVHSVPTLTKSGYFCHKWRVFLVVVGKNPHGPRGGAGGLIVDGYVAARFRKLKQAREFAENLALEKGYLL